jgi:hypothetical protein
MLVKKKRNLIAPNKTTTQTGLAEKVAEVGAALAIRENATTMAKVWDAEATLIGINGVSINASGSNNPVKESSWIFTYFSAKKPMDKNTYVITFKGDGSVTWQETQSSYTLANNIENIVVDSDKALDAALKAGLPTGDSYVLETSKKENPLWVVAVLKDKKYEMKKINAITGELAN